MSAFGARLLAPEIAGQGRPALWLLRGPALVWALALAYVALFFLAELRAGGGLIDLAYLDADDGMRLQSVRDLLAGQGWFDTHQYRYGAPAGTLMHWSRLLDGTLAAGIWLLAPLLGAAAAEKAVLFAWPALLFTLYLIAVATALGRCVGSRAAAFSVVVAANMLVFRDIFGAGEIDHHNIQALMVLLAALSFVFARDIRWAPAAGGLATALSLAIGLETLPYVALIGILYVTAWVIDRAEAARLRQFAAALAIAAFAAFAVQTAPALWRVTACDALSAPWLALVAGAAAMSFVMTSAAALTASWRLRLAAASVSGALLAAMLAIAFPACLAGPYGSVPEPFRTLWLTDTPEAASIWIKFATQPLIAAIIVGPTLTAAIAVWLGAPGAQGTERRLLLATGVLLPAAILLCFLQIRAIYIGAPFIPLAAGWALDRAMTRILAPGLTPLRAVATITAAALLFETTWLSATALAQAVGLAPDPPRRDAAALWSCAESIAKLNALPPGTVLAPMDLGPHILFLTPHAIIVAGYHRNIEGIVAGVEAFSGAEALMRDVVRRDRADYVALCPPLIGDKPGQPVPFARTLVDGGSAPWLEPVAADTGALKVWRVRRDRL